MKRRLGYEFSSALEQLGVGVLLICLAGGIFSDEFSDKGATTGLIIGGAVTLIGVVGKVYFQKEGP